MKKDDGQIIVIALLIMAIILTVALSIVGRSISEISTSTKTEESSRAFSAAEAGIEQAILDLQAVGSIAPTELSNQAAYSASWDAELPKIISPTSTGALEHPPIGKDGFAQFWFVNPVDDPVDFSGYTEDSFDIYFGVDRDYSKSFSGASPRDDGEKQFNLSDQPAIEVHLILQNIPSRAFISKKYYFDSYQGNDQTRNNNGFAQCQAVAPPDIKLFTNNNPRESKFYCQARVTNYLPPGNPSAKIPIMAKVRILYSSTSHPIAIRPKPYPEGGRQSLPFQVNIIDSSGIAGNTKRKIRVYQQKYVMPPYFDYVIFSAGGLSKSP